MPIHLSTTYEQNGLGKLKTGFDYSRCGNPTREGLEKCISAIENGKYTISFSSGCAAISSLMMTLKAGDEVISIDDVYGGTRRLFGIFEKNYNIKYHYLSMVGDLDHLDN